MEKQRIQYLDSSKDISIKFSLSELKRLYNSIKVDSETIEPLRVLAIKLKWYIDILEENNN